MRVPVRWGWLFRKKKTPLRVRTRDHTIGRVKTTWYTVRLQEHWFSRICIYRVIASTKLDRLVLGYIGVDFWISCCVQKKKRTNHDYFFQQPFSFFSGTSPTTDRAPTTFRLLSTTGREACSAFSLEEKPFGSLRLVHTTHFFNFVVKDRTGDFSINHLMYGIR